jgi:histone H3/H4
MPTTTPVSSGITKRHAKEKKKTVGMGPPSLARLARRGGIKRMRSDVCGKMQTALDQFLGEVLVNVKILLDLKHRKTISTKHVLEALKIMNKPLLGY